MNSIILPKITEKITDPIILEHLNNVLKPEVGSTLKFTILNYGITTGVIKEITSQYYKIELNPQVKHTPSWFNLIVGASRPQTLKKILEHATTFGASQFHFYESKLSDKNYLTSKIFENNKYEEYLKLGLSQSAIYSDLPKVLTSNSIETKFFTSNNKNLFVLDLTTNNNFTDFEIDFNNPITLAIGPERGFTKSDLDFFEKNNFKNVKISQSVLRVEHAIFSAISQIELLKLKNKELK